MRKKCFNRSKRIHAVQRNRKTPRWESGYFAATIDCIGSRASHAAEYRYDNLQAAERAPRFCLKSGGVASSASAAAASASGIDC